MNPPSLSTTLLSNPLVALLGVAAFIWFGAIALDNLQVITVLPVFIAGSFTAKALRANQYVRAYKEWNANWRAMNGLKETPRWTFGSFVAFTGMAAAMAYGFSELGIGDRQLEALGFLVFGGLFAISAPIYLIRGLLRRNKAKAAANPKPVKEHIVAVSLPVAREAPHASHALRLLPDYCHRIMKR